MFFYLESQTVFGIYSIGN